MSSHTTSRKGRLIIEAVETPLSIRSAIVSFGAARLPAILDSSHVTGPHSRFSILACEPADSVEAFVEPGVCAFDLLQEKISRWPTMVKPSAQLPLCVGWIGFLSYEAGFSLVGLEHFSFSRSHHQGSEVTPDVVNPRGLKLAAQGIRASRGNRKGNALTWPNTMASSWPAVRFHLYDHVAVFDAFHRRWYAVAVDWPANTPTPRPSVDCRLAEVRRLLSCEPASADLEKPSWCYHPPQGHCSGSFHGSTQPSRLPVDYQISPTLVTNRDQIQSGKSAGGRNLHQESGRAQVLGQESGKREISPPIPLINSGQQVGSLKILSLASATSSPGSEIDMGSGVKASDSSVITASMSRSDYFRQFARAMDYIQAGDIYEVNLAIRFDAVTAFSPLEQYLRLRESSPSTHAAFLPWDDYAVLSTSPELFLDVHDGQVITQPIKGTRGRADDPAVDAALRHDLSLSGKDRAELNMIVDLMRNDLGRVCEYGSVRVVESSRIETLPTVHQQVATVKGRLSENHTAMDLLRATFPGGSITGAPKIRAMEIIEELEPTDRQVYCGSIGILGLDGSMSFNIAIRTMIQQGHRVRFWAGGAIVADSDPQAEYDEILTKTVGLRRGLLDGWAER